MRPEKSLMRLVGAGPEDDRDRAVDRQGSDARIARVHGVIPANEREIVPRGLRKSIAERVVPEPDTDFDVPSGVAAREGGWANRAKQEARDEG